MTPNYPAILLKLDDFSHPNTSNRILFQITFCRNIHDSRNYLTFDFYEKTLTISLQLKLRTFVLINEISHQLFFLSGAVYY